MANQEHLAILKQGVKAWNRWRAENPYVLVDLNQAKLREANLRGYDLFKALSRLLDDLKVDRASL